jgi:hypothetical protein
MGKSNRNGEARRIGACLVAGAVALVLLPASLAAGPTPSPDPAPTTTTPTRTTTTVPAKPKPTPPATTTTRTRVVTPPPPSPSKTTTSAQKPAPKPKPRPKPRSKLKTAKPAAVRVHKPAPTKPHSARTAAAQVPPVLTPPTAGAESPASGSGGSLGRDLLFAAAVGLLAASLFPTRVVIRAGVRPARAATVRTGFAVGGLSVACGYVVALILSKGA